MVAMGAKTVAVMVGKNAIAAKAGSVHTQMPRYDQV